ncbi:hypothetical protein A3B39_04515 [Candidatus Daviesbacteria bacterium RIFCSPLOWO2_01_FULL_37_10]|nr:MAG: hypothetical protein A3B39_04515 [Candidatus Daviesbacteria bacterium RIFCSPLOWO2_01_FULL_37_10]
MKRTSSKLKFKKQIKEAGQMSLAFLLIFLLTMFTFGLTKTQTIVLAVGPNKVTICHATESLTNPYERIVVDEHAISGHFENNGTPIFGHEDDLLFQGEVDCPSPSSSPSPTPSPTPTSILLPTPTPTETPTPTATPTPTPSNNQGGETPSPTPTTVQSEPTPTQSVTSTPTPTATTSATPTPSNSNPQGSSNPTNSTSSDLSASNSSSQGEVLGATSLAPTGTFEEDFMNAVLFSGILLLVLSKVRFAHEKSK